MKKILMILLPACALMLHSCKKQNTSLVGAWRLTNFSGTMIYSYAGGNTHIASYSYNSGATALTTILANDYLGVFPDTSVIKLSEEQWNINADQTYSIKEAYSYTASYPTQVSATYGGRWQYFNNSIASNGFCLEGGQPSYIQSLLPGAVYNIRSISSSALVITCSYTSTNDTATGSPADSSNASFVVTFARG